MKEFLNFCVRANSRRYEWFLSLFIWILCLLLGGDGGNNLKGEEFCGKNLLKHFHFILYSVSRFISLYAPTPIELSNVLNPFSMIISAHHSCNTECKQWRITL